MATLEKIRKKSVLLFIVIIGALLAFILGDFINQGRNLFGPGDTVAEAKGAKVDFNSYKERAAQMSDQLKNNPQYANVSQEQIEAQVINDLLLEKLFEEEYESLGITVTDKQISKLFFDPQYAPSTFQYLMQQFGQMATQLMQTGIVDTRSYADAMKNPGKYQLNEEFAAALTNVWQTLEKNADDQLKQQAYSQVIGGLFTANQVDAKALYNDRNTTTNFAYVRKDFSAIPEKDIKITDEDYQKVYDERKGAFKIDEEARVVKYIVANIEPSPADHEAASKDAAAFEQDLLANEGTAEALKNHKNFKANIGKYTRAKLAGNSALRVLLAGGNAANDSAAAPGAIGVGMVKAIPSMPGTYKFAKVTGQDTGIDNVKFSGMQVPGTAADTIFSKLTLANFDSIAGMYGGFAAQELSLVENAAGISANLAERLANNEIGQIFYLTDTIQSQDKDGKTVKEAVKSAFVITERSMPEAVYDVSLMDYTVIPSTATVRDINSKLHAFVANNGNAKAFTENAKKNGYTVQQAVVSPSTPSIGNARNSRVAVKWAMNADKGAVSGVFGEKSNNNYIMVVAVEDIFDGEYIPVTSELVKEQLKPIVMANKKAEKVINQYKGKAKDINGYASAMGETVATSDATFGDNNIPAIGFNELVVLGKVAAAKPGAVVGPFQGNNAVYVIKVNNAKTAGRPYDFKEDSANFNQMISSAIMSNPLKLLLGDEKVENNILQFTAEEE